MVSRRKMLQKKRRVVASAVGVIIVVSLTLFAVGLVFIINKDCSEQAETSSSTVDLCKHSKESQQSGLIDLLATVRKTCNKVRPYGAFSLSNNKPAPSRAYLDPKTIKNATDSARVLLKDLNSLRIDASALTPRELRALAELQHFLEHNFGQSGDGDYYTGAWMLGPNIMCTDYMCNWFSLHVRSTGSVRFRPKTVQDILEIRDALAYYNRTIYQYMDNIRYGVRSGMVQSVAACLAGVESIKAKYLKVAQLNATGILQERFVRSMLQPRYLEKMNTTEQEKWLKDHGKTVNESIREFLVEYLGKSLEKLLRFLEYENILYCVPWDVSSGLANLPLSHVYFNGTKTNKTTKPFLPTGEKLDGKKIYKKSLAFHTTTNLTADEVYDIGWKHVNQLYPQILELAKNVTGYLNESLAIEKFNDRLTDRRQYYNEQVFPQNESFEEARKNCHSIADAKKFCPKRWEAMQIWFDEEAKLLSKLDPKTCNLFYFTGLKHTTPNCPIQLVPSFIPYLAAPTYRSGGSSCRKPARITLPFFNDNYGPRYMGMSVNAHEARPGHHTQLQGYTENFESNCPRDDLSWLDARTHYSAFSEGWGLYAEYPLVAEFTDAYENEPLSRYGMLRAQIWRALRLVIDSGLHHKGMKRDEALALFEKYLLDTSDLTQKEVTRYQSVPGQATSYKIGQLTFVDLQNFARKHLADKFNLRDFHYEVLRHGSVPLDYIKYQMKKYVACEKDEQSTDCKYSWSAASATVPDSNDMGYKVLSEHELDLDEMLNPERYY